MIKPPCFKTQEQFDGYMENLEATVQDADRTYCWDCTHKFRDEMTEEGRCSHPRVVFVMVDGSLVGKRPKK